MKFRIVVALFGVSVLIGMGGFWLIDDSLGREYAFWMSGVFREAPLDDQVIGPPLPSVDAGGRPVQVGRGTVNWAYPYGDSWRAIMGDMFMNYPQLARFRELDAQLVSSGTALTITFPQPTSSIVLSRWRFGREVESKVISNGYSFVPSTRGVHMFGIWASFPREQSGKGHGTGQYAFIVRVR